jgi:hypothetical protein
VSAECVPCASAAATVDALQAEFDSTRVASVVYSLGGAGTSPLATVRHDAYGNPPLPAALFDGANAIAGEVDYDSAYRDALLASMADSAVVRVEADLFLDEATLGGQATVLVEIAADETVPDPAAWTIRLILVERDVDGVDGRVARLLAAEVPLAVGMSGARQSFDFDFNLDPAWRVQNLSGVALVQNGNGGAILNATRADVAISLQPVPASPLDQSALRLLPNVPNPWSAVTKITFILPRAQPTTLQIINVRGQVVRTLTEGLRNSGYHEFTWDGTDYNGRPVVSGTYIVRLATPDGLRSSKLTRNL